MHIAILDMDSIGQDLDLSPITSLGSCICYGATPPELLIQRLQGIEAVVINKIKMTPPILEKSPSLKLICVAATGFDNVDLAYCRSHGIAVTNVPGYSTHSVAMVTVALVLNLMTHMEHYHQYVKSGSYSSSGLPNLLSPAFSDLYGKTWGIVGYGNIGKKVAQVAQAFGCSVIYSRSSFCDDPDCRSLDDLFRESDIVSLHCPLNDVTRNLVNARRLGLMKKTALLVNVARGAVCDENAVTEAVLSGKIGAFGCDVYSVEPFTEEHPYRQLLELPNVCLTPHMAWSSYEARTKVICEISENMKAFLAGTLRNRVEL